MSKSLFSNQLETYYTIATVCHYSGFSDIIDGLALSAEGIRVSIVFHKIINHNINDLPPLYIQNLDSFNKLTL